MNMCRVLDVDARGSTTTITVTPVDTYRAAAYRATPAFPLLLDEGIYAVVLDVIQVLYHAHSVFRPVSFIQLP